LATQQDEDELGAHMVRSAVGRRLISQLEAMRDCTRTGGPAAVLLQPNELSDLRKLIRPDFSPLKSLPIYLVPARYGDQMVLNAVSLRIALRASIERIKL
jgi:hypothetical protein